MLHRAWVELLDSRGVKHIDPGLDSLDLTRPETLPAFIDAPGQLVVNCAGYTDVDRAENDERTASAVNGEGVGHLARACAGAGAFLIHYGTDYVFDGRGRRPYRVDDPTGPLNAYGRSKLLGERLLGEAGCRHLLVRTSGLYAPWGRNFVRTIAALAAERPVLRVVRDQIMRPTSAGWLARASLTLLEKGTSGTVHVTDGGAACSWFDFAGEVVRLSGASCRVEPCTAAEFSRPAARPAYSVLDIGEAERLLGEAPDWRSNLEAVMGRLESEKKVVS
jgi:dTDP-4-dehydrorhamnose reductase